MGPLVYCGPQSLSRMALGRAEVQVLALLNVIGCATAPGAGVLIGWPALVAYLAPWPRRVDSPLCMCR